MVLLGFKFRVNSFIIFLMFVDAPKGTALRCWLPTGRARDVKVVEHSKNKALLKVLVTREIPPLPRPYLELCIGIPRYVIMDKVVEKSVELGVHRIRPFVSSNSFIKRPESLPESKFQRWQRMIRSSTQQCGRGELMTLDPIQSLNQLLSQFKDSKESPLGLFLYEGVAEMSLHKALTRISHSNHSIWVFVGGEGGFSDEEVHTFAQAQMPSITFGDQVLRVETACVALLSVLKYEITRHFYP